MISERRDYVGARYGMWFFLFTEFLFFGGMFMFYAVFRQKYASGFRTAALEENLLLGSVNTAILLTSSFSMACSISALRRGESRKSVLFQAATIVLAIGFLVIKYFEWAAKIAKGIAPNSPVLLARSPGEIIFFNLYYVMTGIHALHVVIGIGLIGVMIFYTLKGTVNSTAYSRLDNTGLYWHFVDIVWIYLFPLFYLMNVVAKA